ncbi:MAG: hypothetical protein WCC06_10335 [Candidatus Aminicenantales bacterium]
MTIQKILFAAALCLFVMPLLVSAQQVVQTQAHDTLEGVEVDLVSLEVQNNIITVKFRIRNTGDSKQSVRILYGRCYIMDETNQKKYYPLKDSDGMFIAGPMYDNSDGGRFWYDVDKGKSKGFWVKFPQPVDNPETITISIPEVSPFGNIKLGL